MWVSQELTIEPTLNATDRRGVTFRANVILLPRRARLTNDRVLMRHIGVRNPGNRYLGTICPSTSVEQLYDTLVLIPLPTDYADVVSGCLASSARRQVRGTRMSLRILHPARHSPRRLNRCSSSGSSPW